jgi:hypothetical protein
LPSSTAAVEGPDLTERDYQDAVMLGRAPFKIVDGVVSLFRLEVAI